MNAFKNVLFLSILRSLAVAVVALFSGALSVKVGCTIAAEYLNGEGAVEFASLFFFLISALCFSLVRIKLGALLCFLFFSVIGAGSFFVLRVFSGYEGDRWFYFCLGMPLIALAAFSVVGVFKSFFCRWRLNHWHHDMAKYAVSFLFSVLMIVALLLFRESTRVSFLVSIEGRNGEVVSSGLMSFFPIPFVNADSLCGSVVFTQNGDGVRENDACGELMNINDSFPKRPVLMEIKAGDGGRDGQRVRFNLTPFISDLYVVSGFIPMESSGQKVDIQVETRGHYWGEVAGAVTRVSFNDLN